MFHRKACHPFEICQGSHGVLVAAWAILLTCHLSSFVCLSFSSSYCRQLSVICCPYLSLPTLGDRVGI